MLIQGVLHYGMSMILGALQIVWGRTQQSYGLKNHFTGYGLWTWSRITTPFLQRNISPIITMWVPFKFFYHSKWFLGLWELWEEEHHILGPKRRIYKSWVMHTIQNNHKPCVRWVFLGFKKNIWFLVSFIMIWESKLKL